MREAAGNPRMLHRLAAHLCAATETLTRLFDSRTTFAMTIGLANLSVFWTQPALPDPACANTDPPQAHEIAGSPDSALPDWWENTLGTDRIVLPGYAPLRLTNNDIRLYGRSYHWDQSYLPRSITSAGKPLVTQMAFAAKFEGKLIELKPDKVTFTEDAGYSVKVTARGESVPGLRMETETIVEYDGTGMTTVTLSPSRPVQLDGLHFSADVASSPNMRVISFKAGDIRRQKDRQDMLRAPYAGEFINVIGMADGERSFWWFADNAKGWIWNGPSVTELAGSDGSMKLTQHIIGNTFTIRKPITFKINFLATPIRDLEKSWRSERIVYGAPSMQEKALGSTFKIWWTGALAHDAFPYVFYPSQVQRHLSRHDMDAYPGKASIRRLAASSRETYGIHRIPYFSAHALSRLDPALSTYLNEWQVLPPVEFKGAAKPYKQDYGKPVLSHRAKSYTNYILAKLNDVIEDIDISGIYLDHGPPFDSCNPNHGGWLDSNGVLRPSLDILGLRSFLKRLRVLFHQHGKQGYIFIHTSNREIIPAYTFAYAYVDGEQYRNGRVRRGNFLETVSLDEFRTRFAPDQYGLISVWLPVEWTYHAGQKRWQGSEHQKTAYRRVLALALLHDVLDWPAGAHETERTRIIRILDRFGIGKASFSGYWSSPSPLRSSDKEILVSTYHRGDTGDYMFIVMNTDNKPVTTELALDHEAIDRGQYDHLVIADEIPLQKIMPENDAVKIRLDEQDFRILILRSKNAVRGTD